MSSNHCRTSESEENFMTYLKSIFDIIDSSQQGFVGIDELIKHLQNSSSQNGPRAMRNRTETQHAKIVSALNQVAPGNGLLNFQRFSLAMKIALDRVPVNSRSGIGRSLRPRSYLFAVSESSETDSDMETAQFEKEVLNGAETRRNNKCQQISSNLSSKTTESHSPLSDSPSVGGMLETMSGQLFLLKESIQEADKLREWYHTNFIELESQKRDLEDLLSVSDEMVESERSCDIYNHQQTSISTSELNNQMKKILVLNEKIEQMTGRHSQHMQIKRQIYPQLSETPTHVVQKVKRQSDLIAKLESEKTALLKELFHTRAKLNALDGSKEKPMPF